MNLDNRRLALRIGAFRLLLAIGFGGVWQFTAHAQETTHVIALSNRSFSPQPGIEPTLRAALAEAGRSLVHAIIQLKRLPTPDDRARLTRAGISLGSYLGGTAYLAALSRDARLDELRDVLRWAGPLLVEDKMARDLWEGEIHDWAKTEGNKIKVLVEFHDDVDSATARGVLSAHTTEFNRHGPSNTWAVRICAQRLRKLAAEEPVRWLEQGPHPMMPL